MEIYLSKDLLAQMMADMAGAAELLDNDGHEQAAKNLRAGRIVIGSMWENCKDHDSGVPMSNAIN